MANPRVGRAEFLLIVTLTIVRFCICQRSMHLQLQVVMYGYESWTIKRAEHRRTEAFKL